MPLILAIEPDRRQAAQLSVVVRKRVHAELILVDTTERALDAIGNRMPDLLLVPALLSPQDDAALAAALRVIAAAARVQMLTIPVLGAARPAPRAGGMLSALRRGKAKAAETDGCDPSVFAEQIASYLETAARERPNAGLDVHRDHDQPHVDQAAATAAAMVESAFAAEFAEPWFGEPALDAASGENVENGEDGEDGESVSFALEEAVRALFAAPAAADAVAETFDLPMNAPGSAGHPGEVVEVVDVAETEAVEAVDPAEQDEWTTVEQLMAALQLMPLAAIEATEEDEWIAPVIEDPKRVIEPPDEPVRSEREWVALIESLRSDVERLRTERSEKPGKKPAAAPRAARADRKKKPVQDEWGFFDPEQCGFAALLAKLDEVTEAEDGRINH